MLVYFPLLSQAEPAPWAVCRLPVDKEPHEAEDLARRGGRVVAGCSCPFMDWLKLAPPAGREGASCHGEDTPAASTCEVSTSPASEARAADGGA